jgi:hypothetical protein
MAGSGGARSGITPVREKIFLSTIMGRIVKSVIIWCRGLQRRELMVCIKRFGSRDG